MVSLDSRTWLASEPVLVEALNALLDRLQPADIGSAASYAIDGSFLLADRHTPSGDIEIEVGEHDAKIESLFDEADAITNENDHGVAVQVVDRIARILCGIYRVESVYWGGRLGRGLYRADEDLRVGSSSRAGAIPHASSRDGALWLQRVVRRVVYVSRESPGGVG